MSESTDPTQKRIQGLVEEHEILLFMKGTPQMPQCGFSAQVVSILDTLGPSYASVNVLEDPAVRQGIKDFSDWPTIPQLYIRGEFVGGCDIVKEMFESGELEEKLGISLGEIEPPKITVTDKAAGALKEALQKDDEFVRLEIDGRYNHGLSIGPKQPKDVVVDTGPVTLLLDRGSAKRADGATIDFVETPTGAAFKIDNPNEPPKVRPMMPEELKERLDTDEPLHLFDVRTARERELAQIPRSRLLDKEAQQHIMSLPKDSALVFYCHTGARSAQAAEFFLSHGFTQVYNLEGGIDAWAEEIDPDLPRY